MWEWVSDAENQKTLGFLGGGLAALAAAAWAVFTYFRKAPDKPPKERPTSYVTVTADRGGRAAGRDYHEAHPAAPAPPPGPAREAPPPETARGSG